MFQSTLFICNFNVYLWKAFLYLEFFAQAIVKMIDISRASKQEKDDALKESKAKTTAKTSGIGMYPVCSMS